MVNIEEAGIFNLYIKVWSEFGTPFYMPFNVKINQPLLNATEIGINMPPFFEQKPTSL